MSAMDLNECKYCYSLSFLAHRTLVYKLWLFYLTSILLYIYYTIPATSFIYSSQLKWNITVWNLRYNINKYGRLPFCINDSLRASNVDRPFDRIQWNHYTRLPAILADSWTFIDIKIYWLVIITSVYGKMSTNQILTLS